MGRPKKRHRHLPVRMRFSNNAWYYVKAQKWTLLGKTYADALAAYAKLESSHVERKDVNALLDAFLHYQQTRKDGVKLSANTLRSYKHHARKNGALRGVFGHCLPGTLSIEDGRKYLDDHSKYSTARHEVGVLSAAMTYGAERGWLQSNPWLNWKKGAMKKRTRYITDKEWGAILAACEPDMAECLRLLYFSALRINDALAIRWANLKPDGLHVRISKSKEVLTYKRTPALEERLRALRSLSVVSMSLMTVDGHAIGYNGFYKRYKTIAKRAGCPDVTLHDIRRKRITDITNERGIEVAQALAVHTDPKVTKGYVVSNPSIAV